MTVFSPFLILVEPMTFISKGWHPDFRGLGMDLKAGAVLAQDEPAIYWIDMATEAYVGSIFECRKSDDPGLRTGSWRCQLEQKVVLEHVTGGLRPLR